MTTDKITDCFGPALPVEFQLTVTSVQLLLRLLSVVTPWIATSVKFTIRSADGGEVMAVMLCTL